MIDVCEILVLVLKLIGVVLAVTHFCSLKRSYEQGNLLSVVFHSVLGVVYLGCVLAIFLAEQGVFAEPI